MILDSKLPNVGTTIFTVMSALAQQHGAINLSQGFPDFDCPEPLKALVHQYMSQGMNQYAPMAGVPILRQRLAEKMASLYGRAVDFETEITITAGGTQGLFTAIAACIRPDDEVIVIEPAYDSYAPSVEAFGGRIVPYRLAPPQYKVDWEALGALVSPKTKMIVINTPHNPTGKTFSADDMRQLAQLTEGSNIVVLSDEVYEHLVFDDAAHQSVLRFPDLFQRSFAVFSFGKTFHATGWKMGYVVAPEPLMREFRKVHQFNVFCVNAPIQYALADFLTEKDSYQSLPAFYQAKRDLFLELMAESPLKPLHAAGTYFQLFDYAAVSDLDDVAFAQKLTTDVGVAAIPTSVFYSEKRTERIIRLCFAKKEQTLMQAAERLRRL